MTATLPAMDPALIHPAWCLPGFCEQAGPVTVHLSAPIVWQMEGEDVDVIMRRRREGFAGEVQIEVHLSNRAFPTEDITLRMTENDVARFFGGVHELREWN